MLVTNQVVSALKKRPSGSSVIKKKACAACGCAFSPRFLFSITCDFCRSPMSSFLSVPNETTPSLMMALVA